VGVIGLKSSFWLFLLIACLLVLAFPNHDAYALSCGRVDGHQERLETFGGAVYGQVKQIKGDIKQEGFISPKEYVRYILIDVNRSWNMEVASQLIVATDYSWGHPFEVGKSYLLYIQNLDGELVNSPCSPVKEIQSLQQIEMPFGEGLKPISQVNLKYKMLFMTEKDYDVLILGGLLVGGLLMTIFYLKSRRG
jgi:hypothetical protein